MTVILLNCVTLGLYQPCADVPCSSPRCMVLEAADHAIYAYFAVEMLIKVLAMGFIGQRTYLADGWNRLDLFIVIAGCVTYTLGSKAAHTSAMKYDKANLEHTQLALILFSQFSAAVVHHKANDGVADAIRARFKYDTALSGVVLVCAVYSLTHSRSVVSNTKTTLDTVVVYSVHFCRSISHVKSNQVK